MAISKKKSKLQQAFEEEDTDVQAIENLIQAIVENLSQPQQELEPFSAYVQRMRAKIYSEASPFRQRIPHGYGILLSELKKKTL